MFLHMVALRAHHLVLLLLLLSPQLIFLLLLSSCLLHNIDRHHVSALTTRGAHHHHHITLSSSTSSLPAQNHADCQIIDWAQYSLRQSYKKAGGILYKQSILTPAEFIAVQIAIDQMNLKLTDEKESSFATNRIGAVIEKESDVYRILSCSEGSLCRLVNGLADEDDADGSDEEELGKMILSPDIPIEIRIYEKTGAGMEWHDDDIIYQNTKQIEVVFTLENTSDCCTMWRPHDQPILAATKITSSEEDVSITTTSSSSSKHDDSNNNSKYRIESVQTTPNSAVLIKAGGVEHKVSALTYGRRVILKMAFVREGALMSDEMREHVSHHHDSTSSAGNKRKKKRVNDSKRQGGSVEVERKKKRRRR